MGAIPVPRTWVQNEVPPYSTLNAEVYDTVKWLLQPPMCKVRQTATQAILTATFTTINFQTEENDPYNWHNSNSNITRVTPTFPGWYRGWWSLGLSTNNGGFYRLGMLQRNGSATDRRSRKDSKPPVGGSQKVFKGIPFYISLNGTTDYVELIGYQDSGSTVNTSVQANVQAELFLRWWAPL